MASIRKREGKNGTTYLISVSCGRDSSGRQIRTNTTYTPTATTPAKIKKEVAQFADQFEKRVKEGKYLEADRMTFEEFVPVWNENWAKDHLTEGIREGYVDVLRSRVYKYIAGVKMSKINSVMIETILNDMKADGKAIKTIKRTFTAINSVFKYAFRKGIIEENPCVRVELPNEKVKKMEKGIAPEIHCFDQHQAKSFLKALKLEYPVKMGGRRRKDSNGNTYNVSPYITHKTIPTMFQAYFTVALYSGFRRGEMIALTWHDIDFKGKRISINKAIASTKEGQVVKSPKTMSGYRDIRLPEECFNILRAWRKEQREEMVRQGSHWKGYTGRDADKNFVFTQIDGKMMNLSTPRQRFDQILKDYNTLTDQMIKEGTASESDKLPIIRLHDLRHTSASLMIAKGIDPVTVAHRLGHKDVAVTLNTYSHAMKNEDDVASDTLSQLFA